MSRERKMSKNKKKASLSRSKSTEKVWIELETGKALVITGEVFFCTIRRSFREA